MSALVGNPMFWYGLALKIAMTASIVVAASVVVERSGPFVGSLIAALPTAGGAAMIILALEHPPEFIAASAVGSLIANAACALFALAYAALAQKHSLRSSLGGAFLVWLGTVFLLRLVDWSAEGATILNAVIYPIAIAAAHRCLACRLGDVLRDPRDGGQQLDWLVFLRRVCVLSGGDGIILHHSPYPHRGSRGRERCRARAHAADRAGAWPACRPCPGGAAGCLVVLCNWLEHRTRLERAALARARLAGSQIRSSPRKRGPRTKCKTIIRWVPAYAGTNGERLNAVTPAPAP